jgi:hypothetical protein
MLTSVDAFQGTVVPELVVLVFFVFRGFFLSERPIAACYWREPLRLLTRFKSTNGDYDIKKNVIGVSQWHDAKTTYLAKLQRELRDETIARGLIFGVRLVTRPAATK